MGSWGRLVGPAVSAELEVGVGSVEGRVLVLADLARPRCYSHRPFRNVAAAFWL